MIPLSFSCELFGSFSQLKETLNSPFSSVLCFFLFCLRNRERKGNQVRRRQTHRDTEKLESEREGERLLLSSFFSSFFFFFFCFFLPQHQALILGSDSAKLISGREWVSAREREVAIEKTCGDFRNSSPKLYQMILHRTLRNCSHTRHCTAGKRACSDVTVYQLLSEADSCTVNTVKALRVFFFCALMGILCTHFQSAAPGPPYIILHVVVIRISLRPRCLCNDVVSLHCG